MFCYITNRPLAKSAGNRWSHLQLFYSATSRLNAISNVLSRSFQAIKATEAFKVDVEHSSS